jgi:ADP-ribose pyrophosphatase
MKLTEKFLSSEFIYDGKLLKLYRDRVELSDGQQEIREVIRHPGAAVIVPLLADGQIAMIQQYRYALSSETLEFPAGRLDVGEEPSICARRELSEETGYRTGKLTHLFCTYPAPGYTDELLWIYLAEELTPGQNHPDPDEQLYVVHLPLHEALNKLKTGEITDAKTICALLYLKTFIL